MPLAVTYSRAYTGFKSPLVTIETHISNGLPRCSIIGLPETAVKESKDRVRSALLNCQFEFPARRITINLAPAELPKQGSHYDLAIAIGILVASGQLSISNLNHFELIGELALSGRLRSEHACLTFILAATQAKRTMIIAKTEQTNVSFIKDAKIIHANHLMEVVGHLNDNKRLELQPYQAPQYQPNACKIKLEHICGQAHAKRSMQIAATGRHHLLMYGPPGAGKTMLANSLKSFLPPLSLSQAEQTAMIASCSHEGFDPKDWQQPPFRAPHHTLSNIALVGGGRPPRPGEISLAHHGVLFLDELSEYRRNVLECLRQPLESRSITVSRAGFQTEFPAHFQLIATMNPCPCGKLGQDDQDCLCTPMQIKQYQAKISGPLQDRLDLKIFLPKVSPSTLFNPPNAETSSATILATVLEGRARQIKRQNKLNGELLATELIKTIALKATAQELLTTATLKFQLSARSTQKVLGVARTIADLAKKDQVELEHLAEALSYRQPIA